MKCKCDSPLEINAFCTFCAPNCFRSKVEDILCSTLFTNAAKPAFEDIYCDMIKNVDISRPLKIYPLPSSQLNGSVVPAKISPKGSIYAGHDLPVWLNNPTDADVRLMIISQDPRRNEDEMKNNYCTDLGISSPWGIHSLSWRSYLAKGLLFRVAMCLSDMFKQKNGKVLSVYFTDAYKLRGVDSNKIDIKNKDLYQAILQKEIDLVKPEIILIVGSAAHDMINSLSYKKAKVILAPHPNARPSAWGSKIKSPYTACNKGSYYIIEIIKKAISLGIY